VHRVTLVAATSRNWKESEKLEFCVPAAAESKDMRTARICFSKNWNNFGVWCFSL
jgi:hypothetical protein